MLTLSTSIPLGFFLLFARENLKTQEILLIKNFLFWATLDACSRRKGGNKYFLYLFRL
jgi:hypothetical protein